MHFSFRSLFSIFNLKHSSNASWNFPFCASKSSNVKTCSHMDLVFLNFCVETSDDSKRAARAFFFTESTKLIFLTPWNCPIKTMGQTHRFHLLCVWLFLKNIFYFSLSCAKTSYLLLFSNFKYKFTFGNLFLIIFMFELDLKPNKSYSRYHLALNLC